MSAKGTDMTKAEELLACPFCGSIEIERNSDRWGHFFFCECGSRGAYGDTPARACSNWNTRLAAQADAQGGEASAWQETAALWLERKAELATNSLHCGDSSMTIHSTHRYAAGLIALAKEMRKTALSIEAQRAESGPASQDSKGDER